MEVMGALLAFRKIRWAIFKSGMIACMEWHAIAYFVYSCDGYLSPIVCLILMAATALIPIRQVEVFIIV